MKQDFDSAIAELIKTNADFDAGRVTSVAHGYSRGMAISKALTALASVYGVALEPINGIDSRGELRITATNPNGPTQIGCGHFGEAFAALLTESNVRTGEYPPAHLHDKSGWCIINHFDAEKMILRYSSTHA